MIADSKAMISNSSANNDTCCGIDPYKIKKATIIIRSLNHPQRRTIINALKESNTTVTNLYLKLNMEQSILSQHLAVLRRVGLLSQQRKGKFIYYSINKKRMEKINQLLHAFVG